MNQESKPDTEDIDEIPFRKFSIFAARIVITLALYALSCAAQVSAPRGNGISDNTAALNAITEQTKVVVSAARPRAKMYSRKKFLPPELRKSQRIKSLFRNGSTLPLSQQHSVTSLRPLMPKFSIQGRFGERATQ